MNKGLIRKELVFSVIVLLIGVSISSVTSMSVINMDNNPPDAPIISGPSNGLPGQEYTFTFNSEDPDGDDIRFHIDWGDETSNITPFVASGTDADASHTWDAEGTCVITVKAEDIHGLEGFETTFIIYIGRSKVISNMDNNPPGLPIVIGPIGGKPGVTYTFTFIAVDPDGDDVRYIIDWGDGYIDTTTYAPSGFEVDASHMWEKAGVYHGSVKAEDIHGLQGPEQYIKFGRKNSIDKEDCFECQESNDNEIICLYLYLRMQQLNAMLVTFSFLSEYYQNNPILHNFYYFWAFIFLDKVDYIQGLMDKYDCSYYPWSE